MEKSNNVLAKNFISSGSMAEFKTGEDFLAFAEVRERNTQWHECEATHVRFDPLQDEPIMVGAVAKAYGANEDAVRECSEPEHSGLMVRFNGVAAPMGDSCVNRSMMARLKVMHGFYERQRKDPAVFAKDCNSSFGMMPKTKLQVKEADGMVRAILTSQYAPISTPTLYRLVKEFMDANFPEAEFYRGFYSHEFVAMNYDLAAYREKFLPEGGNLRHGNIEPVLMVQSSDVAASSVLMSPRLRFGKSNYTVPLNEIESTKHKGKEMSEKVSASLEVVMASFTDAIAKVEALNNVELKNPYFTLLRAFSAIKWPKFAKKQALEAAENFKGLISDDMPLTAYDAYLAIVDAYSFYARDNENDAGGIMKLGDSVARSVKIRWDEIDLPGEFSY